MANIPNKVRTSNVGGKWMLMTCLISGLLLITLSLIDGDVYKLKANTHSQNYYTTHGHGPDYSDLNETQQSQGITATQRLNEELPQKCSHEVFRKFYAENNHFPGAGRWITQSNTTNFYPYMCQLQNTINIDGNSQCFQTHKVSTILVMGDSNGRRYFEAMIRVFEKMGATCVYQDGENRPNGSHTPDKDYYGFSLANSTIQGSLVINPQSCGSCLGRVYVCRKYDDPPFEITLRSLASQSFTDQSVQIKNGKQTIINTSQEFYFRIFLKDKYPDIFLYFVPFHHIKQRSINSFRPTLKSLRELMEKYIPRRTKIFFIPGHGEFESARKAVAYKLKKFEGYYGDQKVRALGQVLFDELKTSLIQDGRIYGFLDLRTVGSSRVSWSEDGIHMKPIWYDKIDTMLLETFCNSNNSQ